LKRFLSFGVGKSALWTAILVAAASTLAACASDGGDDASSGMPTKYQMSSTQPGALVNPAAAQAPAEPTGPFAHWAAVIIAGDNASSDGGTTLAFDNARKDVATAFVRAGFAPDHIVQFSSAPQADDPTHAGFANVDATKGAIHRLLATAGDGCLIYVTSHGNTQGIKYGATLASPQEIQGLVDKTCGIRPTVMILSACHSGVFIQPLSADNRMVMSAARADRSSFGCGTANKYPYFDQCMIEQLPNAQNFVTLADQVRACVARTEQAGHFMPPSEPQLSIGAGIKTQLTAMPFNHPQQAAAAASHTASP
jgi:hypothetical protein